MKNIVKYIAIAAVLITFRPSFGYNSIIPKDGYDIDRRLTVRQGNDNSFNIARTEHFVVKTTLANPAAQDISRHLEVWHSQIIEVLPRAKEIFAEKRGQRVTMHVFATREHKAAYYGSKEPQKMWIDTLGVFCEKNNSGKYQFQVTALQHEVFHFWNDIFMGREEPGVWEEGGADFFGYWDIDQSQAYNLSGIIYGVWNMIEQFQQGKIPWITYQQIVANKPPKDCPYYAQGWSFFHFMLNSPVGKKHAEVLFTAYATDTKAQKIQSTHRSYYRTNGNTVVFNPQYLQMIERDWKQYLKSMRKPSTAE